MDNLADKGLSNEELELDNDILAEGEVLSVIRQGLSPRSSIENLSIAHPIIDRVQLYVKNNTYQSSTESAQLLRDIGGSKVIAFTRKRSLTRAYPSS